MVGQEDTDTRKVNQDLVGENLPSAPITQHDVKEANRRLYDAVAERYEEIDGRRSPTLERWLRGKLTVLRRRAPGDQLLDLGSGSGLVARYAEGIFARRVGTDLSPRILAAHRGAFHWAVAADVDRLPFAAGSFDAVTCFAVLHHLYAFDGLVSEVARVLRPGGVFYSDHDMDREFAARFHLPLLVYRRLANAGARYARFGQQVTRRLYDLTEWQEDGIDSPKLARLLTQAGFSVQTSFHWFGLTPATDRLFGEGPRRRGWAPLLSMVATKEGT